jgi:signal transduction histidine kinase
MLFAIAPDSVLVLEDEAGSSRLMMSSGSSGASLRGVISAARHLVTRIRGFDPVHVDYVVAAVLLIGFELTAATTPDGRGRWAAAAIGPPLAAAVAIRRRWTLQALALACVTLAANRLLVGAQHTSNKGFAVVAVLLLFYGAGAFLDGRRAWLGLALTTALGAAVSFKGSSVLAGVFGLVAFVWLPWLVGRTRRISGARERTARELAERLDADRELHVRAAALNERVRIAREIHDVIAHSVSVMVIQAAGARTVMDREPERAEISLRSVERAGREALAEMRRLLGVLGDGEELRALAPQPGLDDLAELVSTTRAAGLDTSIRVEGDPVAVSQGLSLCAYRVVQEALTNTLKHAGPTRAEVMLRWGADTLELEVTDAGGRRLEPAAGSSGHGIAGMCERAALHGGTVDARPGPDGGFTVKARIPLLTGSVS